MKIVVTGSLGNISEPLAIRLLEKGHAVTVISSDPGRQTAIELVGAAAAIGSVDDPEFLAGAFAEADAVYAMVPPNGRAADQPAYYRRVGRNYARAIQHGVRRVVHLSNWGASLALQASNLPSNFSDTHAVEELLAELPGLALTHLRPTFFFTNYYWFSGMIREAGFLGTNCSGSRRVPFVHPRDIAAAAAQELTAADKCGAPCATSPAMSARSTKWCA